MFTLVEGGEVYAPEYGGRQDILLVSGKIARVGQVDRSTLEKTHLPIKFVDATGCFVTPGLIDPHEHLLGGSGEEGFETQTPEIALREVVGAGITTVVGCLGTDTTTKTMLGLLAKAKAFNVEGITAFIYSGGYNVPPVTLTGSVRNDMLLVSEVIGAGEIAISDARSTEPSNAELARLVRDAYVGGLLTGKSGITHFHVGAGGRRLAPLRVLLEEYEIEPASLYPTHVERNEALMQEAVDLSQKGVTVDVDTVEQDLPQWVRFYLEHGGDPSRFTASSDAALNSPATLFQQIRECVLEHRVPLEVALPFVTSNTARVLRLPGKGTLQVGGDADLLVLRKDSLEIQDVVAGGRRMVSSGQLNFTEEFLKKSNRRVVLHGEKS
jgi:beta-aspartyl-dipeptidase (metallo-type)